MVTNLKNLSAALDKAARKPGSDLVAAIRADQERITKEVKQHGASYVTVDGHRFRVVSALGIGARPRLDK